MDVAQDHADCGDGLGGGALAFDGDADADALQREHGIACHVGLLKLNELGLMTIQNINQPVESFYGSQNQLGIRPTADIDGVFKPATGYIINPSIYFATQKGAYELTYGSLFRVYLSGHDVLSTQLILGAFNRLNDAVIGVVGFQWGGVQVTASYDATISRLAPYNAGNGAMEFSLIYQGIYGGFSRVKKSYNCPTFF